ncbi:unnamed protein product, partial [Prorocentrum cordatum]
PPAAMARSSSALASTVVCAAALLLFAPAFVPGPVAGESPALRGGAPVAAAAVYGGLAGAVPEPAAAWSEQELNKAGLFFSVFFVFFFVAGLARMLTVGKL